VVRYQAGMKVSAVCARKFSLQLHLRHAFSSNSKQLQRRDSVHLSSVFTDYSFSS